MGGSGDLGECVQAPIARRFAPNVCSALAPPGACSQAIFGLRKETITVILVFTQFSYRNSLSIQLGNLGRYFLHYSRSNDVNISSVQYKIGILIVHPTNPRLTVGAMFPVEENCFEAYCVMLF